ncbi:MAG: hypothetical protein P1U34_07410 [Coxiellaceae bacterium]|nr:hypothetical protein [Coxiellaceae bacterium]
MSTYVCTKYFAKPETLKQVVDFVKSSLLINAEKAGANKAQLAISEDSAELVMSSYWADRHNAEVFRDTIFDAIDKDETVDLAMSQMPERVVYETI